MRKVIIGCTFGVLASVQAADGVAPCGPVKTPMATEFGQYFAWQRQLGSGVDQALEPDDKVRYLRILLKRGDDPSPQWKVTIRDRAGRPLQSVSSQQVAPSATFWTDRLPAPAVVIRSEVPGKVGVAVSETLAYVAMGVVGRTFYSKKSDIPDWLDLYGGEVAVTSKMRQLGDTVGLLIGSEGNSADRIRVWTCSGFLLANDPAILFVTNDHCGGDWDDPKLRWTSGICRNALIDFSWDNDSVSREYVCEQVVARRPDLDLAILRIRALRPEAPPTPVRIRRDEIKEEGTYIIHHPAAETKRISLLACSALVHSVQSAGTVDLDRDFANRCDTESGSSGAPVFDKRSDHLVGVHHLGSMQCDGLNKAVRATKLLEMLRERPDITGYIVE